MQRSYADAEPIHRRAAEDRLERIERAVAAHPDLATEHTGLLAAAAFERLARTDDRAERRRIRDRIRELAEGLAAIIAKASAAG